MRKKIFLVIAAMMFSSALYAVNLDLKGGVTHPTSPDKFGLDTAVAFNFDLNQYWLLGIETGLVWVTWSGNGKANNHAATIRPDLFPSDTANLYYVPALLTLTAETNLYEVIPYLSAGFGWGWAWYRDKTNGNDSFNNYTWQILGGLKWKLKSSVLFISEMGFRKNNTKNSDSEILSMTGWLGRVGVCIPFGSTAAAYGVKKSAPAEEKKD
jgi:hypothetical protein